MTVAAAAHRRRRDDVALSGVREPPGQARASARVTPITGLGPWLPIISEPHPRRVATRAPARGAPAAADRARGRGARGARLHVRPSRGSRARRAARGAGARARRRSSVVVARGAVAIWTCIAVRARAGARYRGRATAGSSSSRKADTAAPAIAPRDAVDFADRSTRRQCHRSLSCSRRRRSRRPADGLDVAEPSAAREADRPRRSAIAGARRSRALRRRQDPTQRAATRRLADRRPCRASPTAPPRRAVAAPRADAGRFPARALLPALRRLRAVAAALQGGAAARRDERRGAQQPRASLSRQGPVRRSGARVPARDRDRSASTLTAHINLSAALLSLRPLRRGRGGSARRAGSSIRATPTRWSTWRWRRTPPARPATRRRSLRRALEIDPHNAAAHYNLARQFEDAGEAPAAIEHYQPVPAVRRPRADRLRRRRARADPRSGALSVSRDAINVESPMDEISTPCSRKTAAFRRPTAWRRDARSPTIPASTRAPPPTPRPSGPAFAARARMDARRGRACSSGTPPYAKWFVGGKLNASVNCLDRHVRGRAPQQGRDHLGRRARRSPHADLLGSLPPGQRVRERAQVARRASAATASRSTCR